MTRSGGYYFQNGVDPRTLILNLFRIELALHGEGDLTRDKIQ